MKYFWFCLSIFFAQSTCAQKGIEKLTAQKIDSLYRLHIDTILSYASYCGECEVLSDKTKSSIHFGSCQVLSGYIVTDNLLIYKQNNNFFMLQFDCNNSTIRQKLNSCKSIPFYVSIISTLKARDKFIKSFYKKGGFLGPLQSDGDFEDATLYIRRKTVKISMADGEKNELYYIYKKYFWIDKQIKLLKLIAQDRGTN